MNLPRQDFDAYAFSKQPALTAFHPRSHRIDVGDLEQLPTRDAPSMP